MGRVCNYVDTGLQKLTHQDRGASQRGSSGKTRSGLQQEKKAVAGKTNPAEQTQAAPGNGGGGNTERRFGPLEEKRTRVDSPVE